MSNELKRIRQLLYDAEKNIEFAQGCQAPEKISALIDTALQKMETACMDTRRYAEQTRPVTPYEPEKTEVFYSKEIYGDVTLMDTGWLHIKLNTLLPNYKGIGGTQYVSDTITRLLDKFQKDGGKLPMFDKAFLAIMEHCNFECSEVFDHDNKGFKAVQNALKGRLFPDDDQFELSLGLFTVLDPEMSCHIYIVPESDASDFMFQKLAGEV